MKLRLAALFALLASSLAPAHALENIRNESFGTGIVAREPSSSYKLVFFDADVTALDVAQGWTFYITERDAGQGDGDQLLKIVVPACAPMPTLGTQVTLEVSYRLSCTADGRLQGAPGASVWIAWCDAAGSHICRNEAPAVTFLETSDPEDFELVVQGDNLVDGATPMAEDAMHCQGTEVQVAMSGAETAGSVPPGIIGIYFDLEGQTCSGTIVPFVVSSAYVLCKLSGITSCGITGAEFRVDGMPSEWIVQTVAIGPNIVVGNPLGLGVNAAFGVCTGAATGIAPILRFDMFTLTPAADVVLSVQPHQNPPNPLWPFVLVTLCDNGYSKVRVDGGAGYINPTGPVPCDAPIAVHRTQWGALKGLYR